MTQAFDPRLVKVTLDLIDGSHVYEDLAIFAQGRLFGSSLQNTCQVKLFNLTADHRNYIITQASPLKTPRTPINIALDIGRESYGTFRLFQGYVIAADVTQPPDIGVVLESLNSNFLSGAILGTNQPAISSLHQIAQRIADRYKLALDFQATNQQIENYSFNGSLTQELRRFEQLGKINAFVSPDNTTLVILDANKAAKGDVILINAATGMVGIPQVTDSGVTVRMMINPNVRLGGTINIQSELNPAANGEFKVVQIHYMLANRADPFWYILECSNLAYYQGTA